ncbi:MAG TPA: AgmX/PglI C-terminal domain-containing protein [Anaeromyxobacteraceae bacterium]|nr:AgmX/PglI C-terminal domain-containing protein [Anaeromyxobacteraceae bacterium]
MAAQHGKVLRVGVIVGGKIVEERVLPARQTVTFGSGPRNTIVVQQAGVPESIALLTWSGDQYHLHFAEGMDGNVQSPGGQADFGALVAQGTAKKQGPTFDLPVREDQRGKIVVGEVNVLWQFVAPPPEAPSPVLPKEARGNHFQSMDRLFVTVLVLSILFHAGTYVALANTPLPPEVTLEEIPDRYAKVLIPEKLPKPPEPEKKEDQGAKKKDEQQARKASEDKKPAESTEQQAARKAARAAAVAKAVQSKGILKVLGALGPGTGGGAVADVFGAGGGMTDVASALSGAGGVAVATDPGAGGGRKGGGQGGAASIGSLTTSGGGQVGYGAKSEVKVTGSVAAEEAEVDSAEIDQQKLGSFIKARMGLIKACYENALKRNPNLKGKIAIRFTILETGGLADLETITNTMGAADVSNCILATMRSWRTQFKPSGPVTVEYPFVFSPVQ